MSFLTANQIEAIRKLKSLRPRIGRDKGPATRIEFAAIVLRSGLYHNLVHYELYDQFNIGERDLDTCFEMGDSHDVTVGLIELCEVQGDLTLRSAIKKCLSEDIYTKWLERFNCQPVQANLFAT